MKSAGLVAGFVLLAVASVLAWTPYSDPQASAYWFGASSAAVFGSVLLAKPFLKPSGEYVSATQSFRFYDLRAIAAGPTAVLAPVAKSLLGAPPSSTGPVSLRRAISITVLAPRLRSAPAL